MKRIVVTREKTFKGIVNTEWDFGRGCIYIINSSGQICSVKEKDIIKIGWAETGGR
jgi:hypothetical protein